MTELLTFVLITDDCKTYTMQSEECDREETEYFLRLKARAENDYFTVEFFGTEEEFQAHVTEEVSELFAETQNLFTSRG